MAHPKKRMSPVRSGQRRRNIGLSLPETTVCPNCKARLIPHTTCASCGYYRSRQVVER